MLHPCLPQRCLVSVVVVLVGGCGADVVVASLLVEDVADVSSEVCGVVVAGLEKAEEEISSECRLADMDDASPSLEVMEAEEFVWFLVFFPLLFGILCLQSVLWVV